MDNYSIKTVTFGGFDKQDVIRYIEQAAEQAATVKKELEAQNEALLAEKSALETQVISMTEEISSLRAQLEAMTSSRSRLQEALSRESAQRQELEALKPLEAEVEQLRPDAEANAQVRDKIGSIECDARKRAADLESSTIRQLQQTVDLFREQYQVLMSTFESAASHVNSELRKVEVNLTQLPRTMDQSGSELNELMKRLENMKEAYQ